MLSRISGISICCCLVIETSFLLPASQRLSLSYTKTLVLLQIQVPPSICTKHQYSITEYIQSILYTPYSVYMPTYILCSEYYNYSEHTLEYPWHLSHSRWPSQCDETDRRCDGVVPNSPTAVSESAPGAQQHILLA